MKLFITGAKGQLGSDLMSECKKRNIECTGVDIEEMDITDEKSVREVMLHEKYDAVIHCAAWTRVDDAEDEDKKDAVRRINATGTGYIANVCKERNVPMMYISTDYVFTGKGEKPWEPDDTDRKPLNWYGQTKYEGELAVETLEKYFIVRIAWVFGLHGNNFIKTMLRLGKERGAVSVVNDQIGTPTYTPDLARLLVDMIQTDRFGRYHATNEGGYISWYDFACEIFKAAGMNEVKVTPVDSSAFPAKAKRPHNSRMDKTKLDTAGFKRLPDWKDALNRYLEELKNYG